MTDASAPHVIHFSGTRSRRTRMCAAILLLLCLCAPCVRHALGQDAASPHLRFPKLSGSVEIVVADRYIYHGYVVDDHQPVVQPELEIQGHFFKGTGWLTGASFVFTVFNSVQFYDQGLSTKDQPLRSWYEAQFEPGLALTFAKDLTLIAKYVRLESPNGAFLTSNAIQLELELDDSRWLSGWALHPRFTWFAPVEIGSETGTEEGHYFEFAIEPEHTINEQSKLPITVALPVTIGFGDKHYYAGRHFGFFSIGFSATAGLGFIPEAFGSWSIGVSGTLYRLGRTPAELTNGSDEYETVVAATLSTQF